MKQRNELWVVERKGKGDKNYDATFMHGKLEEMARMFVNRANKEQDFYKYRAVKYVPSKTK